MGAVPSTADEKLRAEVAVKLHAAKCSRRDARSNKIVLEDVFNAVGPDSAGTVSFQQFKRASERLGMRVAEKQLKAAFSPFEVSHSGRFDCAEFIQFVCDDARPEPTRSESSSKPRPSGPSGMASRPKDMLTDASEMGVRRSAARIADAIFDKEVDLREAFRSWDKKNLGGLDATEFQGALASLGFEATPETAAAVFTAFDLKGDGRVSCWEFTRGLHNLQAAAEATASEEERRARRDRKKASALRKQDKQLAVIGAGLGGGHLPEATALTGALAGNDAACLRKALRAAEDAGLDADELKAAKLKLQQLEELEAAEDALEDAQNAQPRSAERLRRALRDAEAAGLNEETLTEARKSLAREEWRDQVRKRLHDAMQSRDTNDLREAIADGEACSLPEDELVPAREILAEEARKVDRLPLCSRLAASRFAISYSPIPHSRCVGIAMGCFRCCSFLVLLVAILFGCLNMVEERPFGLFFAGTITLMGLGKPPTDPVPDGLKAAPRAGDRTLPLPSGAQMPVVGIGMCCRPTAYDAVSVYNTILWYLLQGGRHIDTAHIYRNQKAIGRALKEAAARGVPREEVFLVSKLWPSDFGYDATQHAVETILQELGVEYIDVHAPRKLAPMLLWHTYMGGPVDEFYNYGCKNHVQCRKNTWKALSELKDQGKIRDLGVSNFQIEQIKELQALQLAPVAVHQLQYHPWLPDFQQKVVEYCHSQKIALTGYSSLGGLMKKDKALNVDDIQKIGAKHKRSAGEVLLRWALEKNVSVIPGTGNPKHMKENLGVYDFKLSAEEARARAALEKAVASRDPGSLQEALRLGERAGLSEEELSKAREVLKDLDGRDQAEHQLREAIKRRDVSMLKHAIDVGKAQGADDGLINEAQHALEVELQKESARQQLHEAMGSRDTARLRDALTAGERQGLSDAELHAARELLQRLERQARARENLEKAMADPSDAAKLRQALEEAEAAGVGSDDLAAARQMLDAETRRAAARDALNSALSSGDASRLRAAITEGEHVGLAPDELAAAQDALSKLDAQSLARQKLRDALTSRDPKDLQDAIAFGEAAGLPDLDLAAARKALDDELQKSQARSQLQQAEASGDVHQLRQAIAEAKAANLSAAEIARAQAALNTAERQEAARRRLKEAVSLEDGQLLRAALDEGEAAGLSEDELKEARQALSQEDLKAVARRRLQDATASRDKEALQVALDSASAAGLPSDDPKVQAAQQVLDEELRKERAAQALRSACAAQDIEALKLALDEARQASVRPGDIADAEAVLRRLEQGDAARQQLREAMASGKPEDLQKAIAAGEAAGLGPELDEARRLLAEEERRAAARRALQKALVSRNPEALQDAIREGEAAGLPAKELEPARAALASEDAKSKARKRLQQAMASKDIGQLKSALTAADRAGLNADDTRAARWKRRRGPLFRAVAVAEAAKKKLREAIASRDPESLRSAIAKGQQLGLDEVKEAQRVLAEEEAKEQARRRLSAAAAGESISELEDALGAAAAAQLRPDELRAAQQRLEQLKRRQAAREALQEALRHGDVEKLKQALQEAEREGVEDALLEQAREVLRQKDRQDKAKEALQRAVSSGNMEELRAAIRQGQSVGLSDEDLADALAKLKELEEEEERRQKEEAERIREEERQALMEKAKQDHAKDLLETALRSKDPDALRGAIDAARKAGLPEEDLTEAIQALKDAEAEQEKTAARNALAAAITSGDIGRLRDALQRAADLGLDESEMDAARKALEQAEAKAAARAGLHDALKSGASLADINASLQAAESAGLTDEADQLLIDAVKKKAAQEQAKRDLEEALSSQDPAKIREALVKAGEAGISANVLQDAIAQLQALERKADAAEKLRKAMEGSDVDVEKLRAAIEAAAEAGLDATAAEERLQEAERRATARRRLSDAMQSGELQALRAALEEAKEAGLSDSELKDGEEKLAQEEERANLARTLQHMSTQKDMTSTFNAGGLDTTNRDLNDTRPADATLPRDGGLSGHDSPAPKANKCTPTSQTRIAEKAEYMFQKTALDDASDDDIVKTMRQRLRKLYVSPAEALSEAMQVPSIATSSGQSGENLPTVDSDVLQAFAEQLQLSLSTPRTIKFLSGIDQAAGGNGNSEVSVPDFLNVFNPGTKSASSTQTGPAGPTGPLGGPGDTLVTGPHAAAATREEKKRQLMQQSRPQETLRQLVLQQRVSQLSRKEAQLVTNLREALFERRSNMQKMFKSVDLNDDGVVTLEEFLHALEGAGVAVGHEIDRARARVTEEEAARMLAYFDRSCTGTLQYNEFMRLLQGTLDLTEEAPLEPELARRIPDIGEYRGARANLSGTGLIRAAAGLRGDGSDDERAVQSAFAKWDVNNDGKISERELLSVLRKIDPKIRDQDVRRLFEKADCNGDGVIDYQEFVSWLFQC
eukprot:s11_g18.t2